ncbi:MAG TPA: energy transducer TonB [Methylocella sp.]|nr:energy transducer TonB [Methylocella sp.]
MTSRNADSVFGVEQPMVVCSAALGSLGVWALAALGAVLLHASLIAIVMATLQVENQDDDLGAPSVEIGVELASPHLDATDLPPGPEAEDSAASPEVVEQKTVAKETDLPKDQPDETEDPDRVVAPMAAQKPVEEDPKIKTVEAMRSALVAASEATALPTVENTKDSPRSTAPSQGSGASLRRAFLTWEKELDVHLNRHKRYPAGEARRNTELSVRFALDRLGHVLSAEIVKTSGSPAFDEAAIAMLRRADPVPAPPPSIADAGLTFTLPVIFHAKGRF